MEAVDDVLKHLRANYSGAFWPKPYNIRRSVESVLSRRVHDGTDKPPERPWEKKTDYQRPTQTAEEKAHVARCMAEIRRHTQNAPSIAERLRHYRKWLDKGNTGTMADAAADYWNSLEDVERQNDQT